MKDIHLAGKEAEEFLNKLNHPDEETIRNRNHTFERVDSIPTTYDSDGTMICQFDDLDSSIILEN